MYATYVYAAEITQANLLADLVLLLTGTTDKAQLSASCVQASTSIDASVNAAGWTVYDASAGTNAQCLRAAVADNDSQYKYLVVDTNSAGYVKLKVYESWNNSTHAGTNMAYLSDNSAYSQQYSSLYGGRIDISASARHAVMFSLCVGTYGSSNQRMFSGILERTRRSSWDTVAAGYPPFVALHILSSAGYFECRRKDITGCDEASSATGLAHSVIQDTLIPQSIPCVNDTFKQVLLPFGCVLGSRGHLGGNVSSLCDVWQVATSLDIYDTLTVDANTVYKVWSGNSNTRFAVRRG